MKKLMLMTALLIVLAASAAPSSFGGELKSKKVVMIVANGLSTQDLVDNSLPNIQNSLTNRAAIGLMNTRAARRSSNVASSYLSIGSGARANAGASGNIGMDRNETITLRGIRQKLPFPGNGQIGTPSFPDMARLASRLSYPAAPGTLGEILRRAGVKRSAYGNADAFGVYHREINLITMDNRGSTDFGRVSEPLNSPAEALAAIRTGLRKSDFVAVEYSPVSKIRYSREFMDDKAIRAAKRKSLRGLDRLFGNLLSVHDTDETMIILISPHPAPKMVGLQSSQAPVIVAALGYRGLLKSASTRWDGVVTNRDIAPTVLSFILGSRLLDMPLRGQLTGRPIDSIDRQRPLEAVFEIESQVLVNNEARSILIRSYITLAVITLVALALMLVGGAKPKLLKLSQPLLLSLLYLPVMILLSNAYPFKLGVMPLVIIPALSLGAGSLTWLALRDKPVQALAVPAIASLIVLLAQLPFHSFLERNSILGMNSIVGARYYGIGNEYTGVLLASSVISLAAWLTLKPPRNKLISTIGISAAFVGLTLIVGLPVLGANVGGSLAAVATGFIAVLALQKIRPSARHIAYMFIGMVFATGLILLTDLLSPTSSHAGRAALLINGGELSQILTIITRKLSNNVRLIQFSSWTNIFIAAGLALVILRIGFVKKMYLASSNYDVFTAGCKSLALGSTAALLFNDSGVVTVAIMILFSICAWLYLLINLTRLETGPIEAPPILDRVN